ncbi:unnamed protein product, partial [Ectocarpus fasciculatus]
MPAERWHALQPETSSISRKGRSLCGLQPSCCKGWRGTPRFGPCSRNSTCGMVATDRSHVRSWCRHFSRYLKTLVFPSSSVANPFPRQTPMSEITGLEMATHAHRPTPAVLLLRASQPSPWYPVRLPTQRCPQPIAPANSASCGEEDEEPPTEGAQPVTRARIVANVVGQLDIDLVVPAVSMAVPARAGRRAVARSSSALHSLENSRRHATAVVAGQQPRHSSTPSRGRASATTDGRASATRGGRASATRERRTRNSSRSRSPSPPPRSRGRPRSPVRSTSPAPRPVAAGVFPYRPVAPSSPPAMENSAADYDLCAVAAMRTSPLI